MMMSDIVTSLDPVTQDSVTSEVAIPSEWVLRFIKVGLNAEQLETVFEAMKSMKLLGYHPAAPNRVHPSDKKRVQARIRKRNQRDRERDAARDSVTEPSPLDPPAPSPEPQPHPPIIPPPLEGHGEERPNVEKRKPPSLFGDSDLPKPTKTGTRLPDDWMPTEDDCQVGLDLGLTSDELEFKVFPEFKDHWRGVPGAKGRKLDWHSTFRNSIRMVAARIIRDRPRVRS